MAYADYINAATLQDTCDADASDTPGKAADCRFLGQSEEATTAAVNRASRAIAENCDILKAPLDNQVAITQVGALPVFGGSSISIDPTGGAGGAVNYTGYLYVGNGSYSGASQEDFDTLFQLLDDDYNEVMVDGVEAKITAIAVGPALGSGFYNAGMVTLTLNVTLPTDNYRIVYARESTLATLPDDALIRADIRGVQEAATESAYKSVVVVAETDAKGPADFLGTDALERAMSALGSAAKVIFVRAGTYVCTTALNLSSHTKLIGEAKDSNGVRVELAGFDLIVGDDCHIEHIQFVGLAGSEVRFSGSDHSSMRHCQLAELELRLQSSCKYLLFEDVEIGDTNATHPTFGINMQDSDYVVFRNCIIETSSTATGPLIYMDDCEDILFENCDGLSVGASSLGVHIGSDLLRVKFLNCNITTWDAQTLTWQVGTESQGFEQVTFENCYFDGNETVAGPDVPGDFVYGDFSFISCWFKNTGSGYDAAFCSFLAYSGMTATNQEKTGFSFEDCRFEDGDCSGYDGSASIPHLEFDGVTGQGLVFIVDNSQLDLNGPLLRVRNSTVDKLHAKFSPAALSSPTAGSGTAMDGMIELLEGAHVTDLSIVGLAGQPDVPLVSMKGDVTLGDPTASPARADAGRAALDGLTLGCVNGGAWDYGLVNTGGAAVWMQGQATLSRMVLASGGMDYGSALTQMIGLEGEYNVVRDCHLEGDGDDIRAMIATLTAGGGLGNIITKNYFSAGPAAVAHWSILCAGAHRGLSISDNFFDWAPVGGPAGWAASRRSIETLGGMIGMSIVNNRFRESGTSGGQGPVAIGEANLGTAASPSGGVMVMANSIWNPGSVVPGGFVYTGATPGNDATNVIFSEL